MAKIVKVREHYRVIDKEPKYVAVKTDDSFWSMGFKKDKVRVYEVG